MLRECAMCSVEIHSTCFSLVEEVVYRTDLKAPLKLDPRNRRHHDHQPVLEARKTWVTCEEALAS